MNRQIDHYILARELGYGGMAVVWRAHDQHLKRDVALKVLHDHIAARPENRDRFEREAKAVARLDHPNIVRIFAVSPPEARPQYIATELIDGPTLREFVSGNGFPLPEAAALCCLLVARALEFAHKSAIIHRDIKPENIMLTSRGVPRLMDFGLARVLDESKLTNTGAILGSPAHMAPELIEGQAADEGVDIFAFGTVLYFATTGRLPFDGRNPATILNAILSGDYLDPIAAEPRMSPALAAVMRRCMMTQRSERFANMGEVVSALHAALEGYGLGDPQDELTALFTDREAYRESIERRVVNTLLDQARAEVDAHHPARATAICDRVLAIWPDDAATSAVVEQLAAAVRVERRTIGAAVLAVIAVLVVVCVATVVALSRPDPKAPLSPAPTGAEQDTVVDRTPAARLPEPAAAGANDGTGSEVVAAAPDSALEGSAQEGSAVFRFDSFEIVGSPPEALDPSIQSVLGNVPAADLRPAEPAPPPIDVRVLVIPGAAQVRIDGMAMGQAGDLGRRSVALTTGRHLLEASIEGLPEARIRETIEVSSDGAREFRFRIPWPDATLELRSSIEGDVFFENRLVGRTNDRIAIENTSLDATFEGAIVIVPSGGGDPIRRTVELRSGQLTSVDLRR